MSPRQSNILILVQMLLTTLCLFVATLLIPQSGYPATEMVSDSLPPPPPRAEHVPPPRYGYVWAPGHWERNGGAYRWVSGNWMEQGGAPRVPEEWQPMDARWHYLLRHWERQ
jgi:WXXGXW repeat (2 copies)